MTLWSEQDSNPLQDIRDFLAWERAKPYEPTYERHRMKTRMIAVFSGGLDSTTMVYHMLNDGCEVDLVSFDYGQRHGKELIYAKETAKQLGLRHDIVDLTNLTHLISNSALTSATTVPATGSTFDVIEVPDGHYAEETMKATVVPNRNMIMLSIAAGIAVNRGANFVATAVHAGDHFIYPDCRPVFIESVSKTVYYGNEGFGDFISPINAVNAPFIHWSKEEIAYRAIQLGVPFHMTWSCYKGSEKHCGRCGTCVERLEAIDKAIGQINANFHTRGGAHEYVQIDKTEYEDTKFWRTAVKEAKQ